MTQELWDALAALLSMWDQYCPPPSGHSFMSAGEDAMDVLQRYGLVNENYESDWKALHALKPRGQEA